jgi:hypothetical protein
MFTESLLIFKLMVYMEKKEWMALTMILQLHIVLLLLLLWRSNIYWLELDIICLKMQPMDVAIFCWN